MTMDVQLYVYDLSQGMARQYSLMITGVQIDAIYHTSIVFGGVEYFFGQVSHHQPGRSLRLIGIVRAYIARFQDQRTMDGP